MKAILRAAGIASLLSAFQIPMVSAVDLPLPAKYRLQTRLSMPNLDENLRSAVNTQQVCISRVRDLFPVLMQPAFKGCRLGDPVHAEESTYQLICESGGGSGDVTLKQQGGRWHGRLSVKMGGKNMTFSQSVTAEAVGDC